jgi:hypothetical protein
MRLEQTEVSFPVPCIRKWSVPLRIIAIPACLRDLPTPTEARASRRREPLRRRQAEPCTP